VAQCLDMLSDEVTPGVSTDKLDRLVLEYAFDHGALPATLMYRGYKKSTCTSINHVVCHGIPGEKPLKEGDIVNIDVTLILDGWTAVTRDRSLSAQFEHTIGVTQNGVEIFTPSPRGLDKPPYETV